MITKHPSVHFKFFAREDEMPIVTTVQGRIVELPLVGTSVETRLGRLPRVYLDIRARYLDIVTVDQQGWPKVMFEDRDLVQDLMVSKVEYESGDEPGEGTVTLVIELGENDTVTFE